MSQYFISPPPVNARNWANSQNLVESTKIERQIVASKKVQRKEKEDRKKEKDERKKVKDERKKEKEERKKEKEEKKKEKKEKSLKQQYISIPTKQVSDESEQLEKSCLTEEHEQPLHVGYLSDGSQNSNKRRRETSPAVESNIKATPVAGNPLRIRIVIKKPKEAEVVPQEDRVCSTSGTERRPSEIPTTVSVSKTCDHDENLLSAALESDKIAIPSESKKRKKHKPSKEARYNTLFDEWVPPCMLLEDNSSSDDWLFGKRRQENASTKAPVKNDEDMIMNLQTSVAYSSLPRARFLSEVGIFSLPYTVPF